MATIIPPVQDPLALGLQRFGQNLGNALYEKFINQPRQQKDTEKLMQFLQFQNANQEQREQLMQQAFASGEQLPFGTSRSVGGQTFQGGIPQFQTSQGRNNFLSAFLGQQISPAQQSQIALNQARIFDLQNPAITPAQNLAERKEASRISERQEDLALTERNRLIKLRLDGQALQRSIRKEGLAEKRFNAAEERAIKEEERKVNAELRAKEEHGDVLIDEIDPTTGRRIQRNPRTNKISAVGGVTVNVGQEERKLTDDGLKRLTAGDDVTRTIDDLLVMMRPGGPGPRNVGLFDDAIRRVKTATGALSPGDQVWKQKFTELQKMINILNNNQRLAKDDFERLKTALPLEILNDAAFKAGLESLRRTNVDSQKQVAQDYIDIGFRVPTRFMPKFDAVNATNEQKAAELRRRGVPEAQIKEALGSGGQ